MKTPKQNTRSVVSTVSSTSSASVVPSGFTLGLDLGDCRHFVCALDAAGNVLREGFLANTRPALVKLLADFLHATVALEAGTHSPWIFRFLTEHGAHVIVANPRKLPGWSTLQSCRKVVRPDGFFDELFRRIVELTHQRNRTAQ